MKSFSLLRSIFILWIIIRFSTTAFSQFENTIGNLAGSDETTDIKPIANNHYALVANTTSYGPQRILMAELNAAGNAVMYKTLFETSNPNLPYTGNSIELDFDAAGNHSGYFVTGCRGNFPTTAILIRTDLNFNPTWAIQMLATDPNSSISECGISLERQPNRDVVVVCRSNDSGNLRFTVSRISASGAAVWSYRYGDRDGLQFIPNESCNGKRGHEDVVTVVGHIHDAGIGHTFVSCIRASNGSEFWRQQYSSDHFHDDGTDIVQHGNTLRYMVEGHAENLTSGTALWAFVLNPNNGNLLNAATYSLLPPLGNFLGRDICWNPLDGTATIAGFCDLESVSGVSSIRTFLMNTAFVSGVAPTWLHYFDDSDPQLFLTGDDAVEFIGGPNPGYVVGTQSKIPGGAATDYDLHAIRVNLLGLHSFADCPIVPFTPEITREGNSVNLKKNKTESTWSNLTVQSIQVEHIEMPCIDFNPPPGFAINNQSIHADIEPGLFPNPALPGSEIKLDLTIENSSSVQIQLFDPTGKLLENWKQWRDYGDQSITFILPDYLSEGIYLIKVNTGEGQGKIFRLLIQ